MKKHLSWVDRLRRTLTMVGVHSARTRDVLMRQLLDARRDGEPDASIVSLRRRLELLLLGLGPA